MPRGSQPGERRGGRQKGSKNKRSSLAAKQALEQGITMAEISAGAARALWAAAHKDGKVVDIDMAERAGELAVKASPYFHPRLATVAHTGKDGGPIEFDFSGLTDDQLDAIEPVLTGLVRSGAPSRSTSH